MKSARISRTRACWCAPFSTAVLDSPRMLGAEVTAVRHLSLREIYLAATGADDAGSDDLA